jgi:hypothetical protein
MLRGVSFVQLISYCGARAAKNIVIVIVIVIVPSFAPARE